MNKDLPTRNRVAADFAEYWAGKLGVDRDETGVVELLRDSADEIERLRAENDRLAKVLENVRLTDRLHAEQAAEAAGGET